MWVHDVIAYLQRFIGNTVSYLCDKFCVTTSSKSKNFMLVNKMLESFEDKLLYEANASFYGVNIKTIQLKNNGKAKEGMSFSSIKFTEIVNENWEDSEFRRYLSNDFLFIVFKETETDNMFYDVMLWHIPNNDLEGEVKEVWDDTKKKLLDGDVFLDFSESKTKTTFKNELSTHICHVRPHGSSGTDVIELPVPDKLTGYSVCSKHSFWFNHEYINNIVNRKGDIEHD